MSIETKVAKINGKFVLLAAGITGVCTIISSIISNNVGKGNAVNEIIAQITDSINIYSIDELITKYNQLSTDNLNLKEENITLSSDNTALKELNTSLLTENESLKNKLSQYDSLEENYNILMSEHNSLQSKFEQVNNELQELKNNINNSENEVISEQTLATRTGKKVSIFDMDTITGNADWNNHSYYSNEDCFIDTYGNEYLTAYVSHHRGSDKNSACTYSLDSNYSICEGKIAWAKNDKDSTESAWIEFYSDDESEPIYVTNKITASSEPLTFSFSVEGVKKLIVVKNGTSGPYSSSWIIYPYFNLIE